MKRSMFTAVFVAMVFAVSSGAQGDAGYSITHDHIYGHKAGMALTFDVVRPTAGANGVGLLYMVSGGWVSNYFDLNAAMAESQKREGRLYTLVEDGYTLFIVRHGSSPYFKVPDAVADVRRAVRFIRHEAAPFGVDPDRLGVFGASAGGHLSLMLATTGDTGNPGAADPVDRESSRVAAAVAYFPPVDLRQSVGPSDRFPALDFDPELADDVSPVLHVSGDDAPALMIHGDEDDLVPMRHSERMYAALQDAGVPTEFIVIKGADHGFNGKHSRQAAAALAAWFDQHLLEASTD